MPKSIDASGDRKSDDDDEKSSEDDEYWVEKVLKRRRAIDYPDAKWEYFVKWHGWSSDDNTWEPDYHLDNAQKILGEFLQSLKKQRESNDESTSKRKATSHDEKTKSQRRKSSDPTSSQSKLQELREERRRKKQKKESRATKKAERVRHFSGSSSSGSSGTKRKAKKARSKLKNDDKAKSGFSRTLERASASTSVVSEEPKNSNPYRVEEFTEYASVGIANGLVVQKIWGLTPTGDGGAASLVTWRGSDNLELVPFTFLHRYYPRALFRYLVHNNFLRVSSSLDDD